MERVMKRLILFAMLGCAPIAGAWAQTPNNEFIGNLRGANEVPALSTTAKGEFRSYVYNGTLRFKLSYARLEGSVTQAHIHLGQPAVNGGIAVWLCSNMASPPTPPGVMPCPPAPATITGIITPNMVVGPAAQGLAPGEFNELIRSMLKGITYANVHSDLFPGGEARGKVNPP